MHEATIWQDFIAIYDDALPPEFCQRLIKEFNESDKRVSGKTGNGGVDKTKKNSEDITLNFHQEWSASLEELLNFSYPFIESYLCRLMFPLIGAVSATVIDPLTQQLTKISPENFEHLAIPIAGELIPSMYRYGMMNLQKYPIGKGGYFHWHSEVYPSDERCEPLHRVLLFMFYLNDVGDGGETEFYYQKLKIKPKTGRMVIAPAGFTHTHRGNIPISNDKYIATSWLMFQRADQMYEQSPPVINGLFKRLYRQIFN